MAAGSTPRTGTAASVLRIVPEDYSPVIVSTPRTPTSSRPGAMPAGASFVRPRAASLVCAPTAMGPGRADGRVRADGGRRYRDLRWPLHEVGALLEATACHPGRSAAAHLSALAAGNDVPRARVGAVLGFLGPAGLARRRAATLSLGMARRLGIGRHAARRPRPAHPGRTGQRPGPEGVRRRRTLLRELAAEGRAVFVSGHLIGEVAPTAERLVVLAEGRLVADTSVAELTARHGSLETAFLRLTSAVSGERP